MIWSVPPADAVHARVSPQARNPRFLGVSQAADDLHGVVAHLERRLRAVQLGERRRHAQRFAVVLLPSRSVDGVAHVVDLDAHVHQHFLDHLELPDGLAELLALRCVQQGVVVGADGHAERIGCKHQTLHVEVLHDHHEALVLVAHHVRFVDYHVVQVHFAQTAGAVPHLVQVLDADALCVHRHEPAGHRLLRGKPAFEVARHAQHVLRAVAVGGERLVPVDDHLSVAADVRRGDGVRIRPRLRLAQAQAESHVVPGKQTFHDGLLLLFRAEGKHVVHLQHRPET